MSINNYDELRINDANQSTLSVARWNGLVDELQRLQSTLNRVHLSAEEKGRIGIGTIPDRALHIKGDGGVSDDLLMMSTTNNRTSSAAIIMAREREDNAPLETGSLLGKLSFRGFQEAEETGTADIRTYYRKGEDNKHNTDMIFYTSQGGELKQALELNHNGEIKLKGALRGADAGGALKIQTNSGYVHIGADNKTYAHIKTDRPQFYFDKKIIAKGGSFEAYSKDNLSLITSGSTRLRILGGSGSNKGFVGINTTSPTSTLHVRGQLTLQNVSSTNRGWIVMKSNANNDRAKVILKGLDENQAIIGGAWDDYFYLYWKNKAGKTRRAMIKGSSF